MRWEIGAGCYPFSPCCLAFTLLFILFFLLQLSFPCLQLVNGAFASTWCAGMCLSCTELVYTSVVVLLLVVARLRVRDVFLRHAKILSRVGGSWRLTHGFELVSSMSAWQVTTRTFTACNLLRCFLPGVLFLTARHRRNRIKEIYNQINLITLRHSVRPVDC